MSDQSGISSQTPYDLIIIGAGAAGLSLMLALSHAGYRGKVLLLDDKESLDDERIWSFWKTQDLPDYLLDAVDAIWHQWSIESKGHETSFTTSEYPYCSLRSSTFYKVALNAISEHENFECLLSRSVDHIDQKTSSFAVKSGINVYQGLNIVDTRPSNMQRPSYGLYQCFKGVHVTCKNMISDSAKVRLMHDMKSRADGLEFIYILPFTSDSALIEFTGFYSQKPDMKHLDDSLQTYVQQITDSKPFEIISTEQACLPMFVITPEKTPSGAARGGISAGAMRASTGYSFLSIQRWALATACALIKDGRVETIDSIPRLYKWMDKVMLTAINSQPDRAADIFQRFAQGVSAAGFARFMSEQATFIDFLRVIVAMPKWLFFKSALKVSILRKQ